MSTSIKPPFDPELAELLKYMPKPDPSKTDLEIILEARETIAPQSTPEYVLTDPEIVHSEVTIPGPAGELVLSILRRKDSTAAARPGIYYIHGGGMVVGTRFFFLSAVFPWIKETDAILITPEYRLAPENPDPAIVEDCWSGLKWVGENLTRLGIDPNKLLISGGSAGGGIAAGMALMARDMNGPKICAQFLLCPMLDDRVNSVSSLQYMDEGTYTGTANIRGWNFLLPGKRGSKDVSIYTAPARATDLKDLPPAYIEVGSAEPFRDENVAYASKLWEDGVQAELHVWPGVWHAYDILAPHTKVVKDALNTRMAWLKRTLD